MILFYNDPKPIFGQSSKVVVVSSTSQTSKRFLCVYHAHHQTEPRALFRKKSKFYQKKSLGALHHNSKQSNFPALWRLQGSGSGVPPNSISDILKQGRAEWGTLAQPSERFSSPGPAHVYSSGASHLYNRYD